MNCIALLSYARPPGSGDGFDSARKEITEFVGHWNGTAMQAVGVHG
jgi:hypothetical protein